MLPADPFEQQIITRVARLEKLVEDNGITAGTAWDKDHTRMARYESGTLIKEARDRVDLELHDLRYMLREVTTSINDLSATLKWLLVSATLILAVVVNIGWKIAGSF